MDSAAQALQLTAFSWSLLVVMAATFLAGTIDVARHKIPNWLTFGLIASGFVFHFLLPMGEGWLFAIAGFSLGCAALLPLFALGGVGAGDVKLLAGIGSWVGLHDTLAIFLVFGLLAGLYSAASLLGKRLRPHQSRRNDGSQTELNETNSPWRVDQVLEREPSRRQRQLLPMAPVMAMAVLILAVLTFGPCDRAWGIFCNLGRA